MQTRKMAGCHIVQKKTVMLEMLHHIFQVENLKGSEGKLSVQLSSAETKKGTREMEALP